MAHGTWTHSSGTGRGVTIGPTDSTTGTGGLTALQVNMPGTGTGTGAKYLFQGQKASVDKWWVNTDAWQFMANVTAAPVVSPVGGGYFYVQAGALRYMGSAGTSTQIAPA